MSDIEEILKKLKISYGQNNTIGGYEALQSYFLRLSAMYKLVIQQNIASMLKPFEFISPEQRVYRLYAQPLLFLVALTTLILIAVYTRKTKSFKSYILTVTFLLNDTIGILLPLPFHFAFLPSTKQVTWLSYDYCEAYRMFVSFLPQVLYYHSQWLKSVACLFECLSIYNPQGAAWFYRKRFLTTLLVVSLFVATGISSLMHYDVKFEKFILAHNENGDIVETCIMVPSAIYDVDSRMYNMIRIIAPMTIGIVVPFVCMLLGSIILMTKIYSQSLHQPVEARKISPAQYQHVTFVATTSVLFISILLPRLAFEILVINEISQKLFNEVWTRRAYLMSQIMYQLTVPATVSVYYIVKKYMDKKRSMVSTDSCTTTQEPTI